MSDKALLPPKYIDRHSAWIGQDLTVRENEWITVLSPAEITELEKATRDFIERNGDIAAITKDGFPLPLMGPKLAKLKQTLINGIGFEVLRGLPVGRYSTEFSATLFCGVGSHLGLARSQNAMGHILGHVRDIGADATNPNARIYQTSERQTFHTDSADVVGLLCLKTAKEGGKSLLVSTETIYNALI
jgi:hypothetical protein